MLMLSQAIDISCREFRTEPYCCNLNYNQGPEVCLDLHAVLFSLFPVKGSGPANTAIYIFVSNEIVFREPEKSILCAPCLYSP